MSTTGPLCAQRFLESMPQYRRNAWHFFRSFRDRDELIQNAIGNAWIAFCQTGKRPRFKLCCFRAMNEWFGVKVLGKARPYVPGSRVLRKEPRQLQGDVRAKQPEPWLLAYLRLDWRHLVRVAVKTRGARWGRNSRRACRLQRRADEVMAMVLES